MDYYSETHFALDWPTEACDWALRFKAALDEPESAAEEEWQPLLPLFDDDPPCLGFDLTRRANNDGLDVSAPGYLCAESLAIFIQIVLRKFELPPVQVEWANYGANGASDGFGGGAAVVSREKITLMTTADWLYRMKIAPDETPAPLHPAPGFLTTVIAQEGNRRMEQLFDLLSQLDAAFKQGLPDSLATLNVALDLNAGYLNGAITYEQWRALYQPVMAGDQPHPFSHDQLPGGISPRQVWTLLPTQNGGRLIVAGDVPEDTQPHPRFLTGVPWNNAALVVKLDQADPVMAVVGPHLPAPQEV